jgi:hypothetical protein
MTSQEEIAPALARWLAPYVAEELNRLNSLGYDEAVCAAYVRELGQGVLNKAGTFFGMLEHHGKVGSLDLASAIGTDTPRNIPANLTNSLKQRAAAMGLTRPWDETKDEDNRTVWIDRDGIASRMNQAVMNEQHRRSGPKAA